MTMTSADGGRTRGRDGDAATADTCRLAGLGATLADSDLAGDWREELEAPSADVGGVGRGFFGRGRALTRCS